MAVKVGEAYVEIYGDLDRRRISSDAETAGKLGGSLFGDAFTKETERAFRAQSALFDREGTAGGKVFGSGFTREVHKAVSGMDIKIDTQKIKVDVDKSGLEKALAGLNVKMPDLDVNPRQALANIAQVRRELEQLARTTTSHEIRVETTKAIVDLDRTAASFKRFGVEGAKGFTDAFGESFQTFARALPVSTYARAIMTPFGGALIAIGVPIITTVGAVLGSALGGAILGAVGAAGIAGGIMLAVADPRIEDAFEQMFQRMIPKLANSVDAIKAQLLGAIDDIEAAFGNIDFERFFTTLAPVIGMIAESIRKIGPTLDDIIQKFGFLSVPIGQVVAQFIEKLVPAVERFVDKLAEHMPAIQSAFVFLGDVIIGLIDLFGDLIAKSAEVYETIALSLAGALDLFADIRDALPGFADNLGLTSDKARAMADNIRASGDASGALASAANQAAMNGITPLGDAAETAQLSMSELKKELEGLNSVAIGQNEAAEAWEAAWDRIVEAVGKGSGSLDINTEAGRKNRDMVQELAEKSRELALADIEAGVSVEEATKKHDQRVDSLINEVFHSEGARAEARRLIEQYGAIPDNIKTQLELLGNDEAHAGTVRLIEKYDEVPENVNTDLSVSNWGETIDQLDQVGGAFDNLKGRAEIAGTTMQEQAEQTRQANETATTGMQGDLQSLSDKMSSVQLGWGLSWGEIKDMAQGAADHLSTVTLPGITGFFTSVGSNLDTMKIAWGLSWTDIKNLVQSFSDHLVTVILPAINGVWDALKVRLGQLQLDMAGFVGAAITKFGEMRAGVVGIFEDIRDAIGRILSEAYSVAFGQVNRLIGLINGIINAVNAIPGVKIPNIAAIGQTGAPAGGGSRQVFKAHGGAVYGGPPGTDTVPAMGPGGRPYMLDNGEHILTKSEVAKLGGQGAVYRLRGLINSGQMQMPIGMAAGGRVGGGNDGLLESHRDHVHVAMDGPPMSFPQIIAHAAKSGIPYNVSSTFRPGSRGSGGGLDHHSTGRAVDFAGYNQDKLASFFQSLPGVIELIHRSAAGDYAIFGSGGGGIAWIMSAVGKLAKAALDKAVQALDAALPQDPGLMSQVIRGLFKHGSDKLVEHFTSMASAISIGGGGAAPTGQLLEWIKQAQKYVKIEDIGALNTLIQRESGGNPRAINLDDMNAKKGIPSKGLMQTIDPTFQQYRDPRLPNDPFDPVANIVAGMNYIHARYGGLHNVQQADASKGARGYSLGGAIHSFAMDNSGVLPSGSETLVRNSTNETEYAMTARHFQDFVGGSLGGPAGIVENHITVVLDGEVIDQKITRNDVDKAQQTQAGRRP